MIDINNLNVGDLILILDNGDWHDRIAKVEKVYKDEGVAYLFNPDFKLHRYKLGSWNAYQSVIV